VISSSPSPVADRQNSRSTIFGRIRPSGRANFPRPPGLHGYDGKILLTSVTIAIGHNFNVLKFWCVGRLKQKRPPKAECNQEANTQDNQPRTLPFSELRHIGLTIQGRVTATGGWVMTAIWTLKFHISTKVSKGDGCWCQRGVRPLNHRKTLLRMPCPSTARSCVLTPKSARRKVAHEPAPQPMPRLISSGLAKANAGKQNNQHANACENPQRTPAARQNNGQLV
jgi:hypothetical protein